MVPLSLSVYNLHGSWDKNKILHTQIDIVSNEQTKVCVALKREREREYWNLAFLLIIYSAFRLPKPDANFADASRLPKPEANLADAKRLPRPLANLADANRLPSPLANLADARRLAN